MNEKLLLELKMKWLEFQQQNAESIFNLLAQENANRMADAYTLIWILGSILTILIIGAIVACVKDWGEGIMAFFIVASFAALGGLVVNICNYNGGNEASVFYLLK